MRCPDCNKFVSMDLGEPEVEGIEVDVDLPGVTANVRIQRSCTECGTVLKTGELELAWNSEPNDARLIEEHLKVHKKYADEHDGEEPGEIEVEEDGVEGLEDLMVKPKKPHYGATVNFLIKCSCDPNFGVSGGMTGWMPGSEMEECC